MSNDVEKEFKRIAEAAAEAAKAPQPAVLKLDLTKFGPSDEAGRKYFASAFECYVASLDPSRNSEGDRVAQARDCLVENGLSPELSDQLIDAFNEALKAAVLAQLGL